MDKKVEINNKKLYFENGIMNKNYTGEYTDGEGITYYIKDGK